MTYLKNTFFLLLATVIFIACGGETATQETATTESNSNSSGILEPVKWSFDSKSLGNDEFELTMTAKMDKGWSIYCLLYTSDAADVCSV